MESKVNFRKTRKGYSADFCRPAGFGYERRYYRSSEVTALAKHYGWATADDVVPGEDWTVAEMLITHLQVAPYRTVATY